MTTQSTTKTTANDPGHHERGRQIDQEVEHEQDRAGHRQEQEHQTGGDVAVRRDDQVVLHPAAKHDPVERNRRDQTGSRQRRAHQRDDVEITLEVGRLVEARGEGQASRNANRICMPAWSTRSSCSISR